MTKTYVKVDGVTIIQILDYRNPRYQEIITSIPLDGYQEVTITDRQIDDFVQRGVALDVADGVAVTHVPTPEEIERQLGEARGKKIAEIEAYDASPAVNEFTIGGAAMWLSREERAALKLRFEAEQAVGKTETTLWFDGLAIPIPIETGTGLLMQLELYASASYDRTQQYIAAVKSLAGIDAVRVYDYTADYPEKLNFNF